MNMKWLVLLIFMAVHVDGNAQVDLRAVDTIAEQVIVSKPDFLITQNHQFYGLAFVYNEAQPIYLIDGAVNYVDPEAEFIVPEEATDVGWKTRYQIGMIATNQSADFKFIQNQLHIDSTQSFNPEIFIGQPEQAEKYQVIKYSHLWGWMKWITTGLEWMLVTINKLVGSWGWSIVVFSLVIRVLLFPVGQITAASQRKVSRYQTELEPILKDIKLNYQGEQAHNKLMAAHKKLGITPFFSLKPMMLNLIQFPILIAVFNMLGELAPLQNTAFLWMHDLALPDVLFNLPFTVPFMGDTFNLLPFVMTLITIISTRTFQNNLAPEAEVKRQKRNLYFMGLGFFILCYPFPSSMVFYWALANFWQFLTQLIINKKNQAI